MSAADGLVPVMIQRTTFRWPLVVAFVGVLASIALQSSGIISARNFELILITIFIVISIYAFGIAKYVKIDNGSLVFRQGLFRAWRVPQNHIHEIHFGEGAVQLMVDGYGGPSQFKLGPWSYVKLSEYFQS